MKFIIRNLGWILLIIFFVFMLYLISGQNNLKTQNINTSTGVISNLDNTKEEKIIDTKVISDIANIKNISDEISLKNISKEASALNINSNTGSFIDKIKNYFSLNKNEEEVEEKIEEEKVENIKSDSISIKKEIKNIGVVDEKLIKKVDKIIGNKNLVENNDKKTVENNDKKIENTNDKIREIGVKSIFLNNAYFTERLYTAYKGDKLEQLTSTNKYGCFKVKVISSKNKSNIGKTAWTCEYYMKGKTDTLDKFKSTTKNYYKNIYNSKINSINKTKIVSVNLVFLNNAYFTKRLFTAYKGDKLEQLTSTNKYGCFKVKIISSKNKLNNGKIAWTCKKYLK